MSAEKRQQIGRRAAVRVLLKLHGHLANALACMLTVDIDQAPDGLCSAGGDVHDKLIKVYETEIRSFQHVLITEWTPATTGLVLSSSGKELVNWPLHCMTTYVPLRSAPPRFASPHPASLAHNYSFV